MAAINLQGKVFGKLKCIKRNGSTKAKKARWDCICACGAEVNLIAGALVSGRTKSCGCQRIESNKARKTHGHATRGSNTATYRTWGDMIKRCTNPKSFGWPWYGGRGIKVCERWLKYENFLADVGEKPHKDLSIDRIDCNGNYEPGNVRWADRFTQANNRRRPFTIPKRSA